MKGGNLLKNQVIECMFFLSNTNTNTNPGILLVITLHVSFLSIH